MSHPTIPEDDAGVQSSVVPGSPDGSGAGVSTSTLAPEGTGTPVPGKEPLLSGPAAMSAAKVGLFAYGAAWVYSFVALVVARLSGDVNEVLDGTSRFSGAFQLVGMAFLAPLRLPLEQLGVDGSVTLTFVPVSVTAVGVGVLAWLSARAQRGVPSSLQESLLAALVTGAVFAVVSMLLSVVFALHLSTPVLQEVLDLEVGGDASVVSLPGFLLVLLVATLVAAGARVWAAYSSSDRRVSAAGDQLRTLGLQIVCFSVLAVLLSAVAILVDEGLSTVPTLLASAPLLWGNVLVYLVTLGHFGAIEYSASGGGSFFGVGASDSERDVFHILGEGWSWAVLLLLLAVVTAVLAASVAYARNPRRACTNDRFTYAAAVFGFAGAVLTLSGRVAFAGEARGGEGDGWVEGLRGSVEVAVGPAAWMFLLMAAWGVAVEATRRYVAPTLAPMLPARVVRVARVGVRASAEDLVMAPPTDAARKRTRTVMLALGAVMLLAVVVAGVRWVGNAVLFSPSAPVEEAMDAVKDGDVETLEKLVGKSEIGDTALLSKAVYGTARYEDLSFETVEKDGWDDDHRTIVVKASAGDKEWRHFYDVERSGRTFGLFDSWELVSFTLPQLNVDTSAASTVTVNGVEIEPTGEPLAVLPGRYTFSAPAGSEYFEFNELSYEVTHGRATWDSYKALQERPTDALLTELTEMGHSLLDECAASTTEELPHDACPEADFGWVSGDLGEVTWTVDSYPQFKVVRSETGWRLETTSPGAFWGSAVDGDGDEVTTLGWYDEPDEVYLGGDVSVHSDGSLSVAWTNDDYYW